MIARHATQVVFWSAVFISLVSAGIALIGEDSLLVIVGASIAFNVWSMIQNERGGFVRSKEIRRAYEPARHFNAAQVFIVMGLVMVQVVLSAYLLLT